MAGCPCEEKYNLWKKERSLTFFRSFVFEGKQCPIFINIPELKIDWDLAAHSKLLMWFFFMWLVIFVIVDHAKSGYCAMKAIVIWEYNTVVEYWWIFRATIGDKCIFPEFVHLHLSCLLLFKILGCYQEIKTGNIIKCALIQPVKKWYELF